MRHPFHLNILMTPEYCAAKYVSCRNMLKTHGVVFPCRCRMLKLQTSASVRSYMNRDIPVRLYLCCELSLSVFRGLQVDPQLLFLQSQLRRNNMTYVFRLDTDNQISMRTFMSFTSFYSVEKILGVQNVYDSGRRT